jgi:DNA polymerase I-like protein with 3'-5' exonuclease and polymerase domains
VFHNTNFDRRALESIGIKLPSQKVSLEDTLVASHVICSGDVHGLKELAVKYLNYFEDDKNDLRDSVVSTRDSLSRNNPTKIQYAKKGHPHFPASRDAVWQQDMWLDMPLCKRYATGDVERTWLLYKVFHAELLRTQLMPQYRFRMKMLPILYRMQTVGIHIYTDKINRLIKELDLQIYQLEKNVSDECPYTISLTSPDDLRLLLYTVLKLEPINYTDSGLTSTDEGTLNLLEEEHDELDTIRYLKGWRKANKVRTDITAYKKWSDNNSRLHSSLNLTGTHWTRQTSSDPNQQNFNKKLKFIFGPPEGYYWLYADVVNIELRIWAYDVGAVDLIAAFERGESVHMIIARALYPDLLQKLGEAAFKETKSYTKCKGGTFARIYGGGVNKVNKTYGVQGACDVIDAKLPEVGQYFAQLEATRAHNETVFDYPCIFTIQGYRLDVPINKPYTVSSGRIQGSAGMIVQDMMIHLDADPVYKTKQCEMIQQVHDSLTLEIPCHTNSKVTNTHLISVMERTGEKHIPTCPMDYEVIPYHGDQEPEFRDYTFIPKKHKDYDIEMYIEDHKYKAVATYDKDDIITEYAATKQEAVTRICSQIDENEVPF